MPFNDAQSPIPMAVCQPKEQTNPSGLWPEATALPLRHSTSTVANKEIIIAIMGVTGKSLDAWASSNGLLIYISRLGKKFPHQRDHQSLKGGSKRRP